MRIAIPQNNHTLSLHFGHCRQFDLFDVDQELAAITAQHTLEPPPHEPGVLPRWLAEQNVDLVIAGGMGQRALQLFASAGLEVIIGAPPVETRELVQAWLDGELSCGTNACDH